MEIHVFISVVIASNYDVNVKRKSRENILWVSKDIQKS